MDSAGLGGRDEGRGRASQITTPCASTTYRHRTRATVTTCQLQVATSIIDLFYHSLCLMTCIFLLTVAILKYGYPGPPGSNFVYARVLRCAYTRGTRGGS